ncbi:MAG: alpha/beta fold hydrolase [Armatimonadetes bacterium]|nr:alpha/beta fold hydrolase [Armatimonadota bacterium]
MRRKRRWRKVTYFLVGLFVAYWVGCYYLAVKYVRPGTVNESGPPDTLRSIGNPIVWATPGLAEGVGSKPVFVVVHGYRGSQSGWAKVADSLSKRGFEVVVPALPGHDSRTDETSGFGRKESQVVVDCVAWARKQSVKPPKVYLLGVSMGGAACWLASEKDPTVDGVVTEGCFARLDEATRDWFDRKAPGSSVYLRPVIWFASWMSGVDPKTVNPVEAAAAWKGKPSLIIHGEDDQLFPTSNGRTLAGASGGELWIVPGAKHAECSNVAFDEYLNRLVAFTK